MSQNPVRRNYAQPHHCSPEIRLQAMSRSPLSRDLDQHLSAGSGTQGDPVILAGEVAAGSSLLVSGRAQVTRGTSDGREITVDIASPGVMIGVLVSGPILCSRTRKTNKTALAMRRPRELQGGAT